MSDGKRDSERAAALEAKAIVAQETARQALDKKMREFVLDIPEEDLNSAVQNVLDLMTPEQYAAIRKQYAAKRDSALPITKPPITRPTSEALRASRAEPDTVPSRPDIARRLVPTPPRDSPVPASGHKILVAEDDSDILATLAGTLESEGFRVWRAKDGLDALKQLYTMPRVDLILLDLMMPRVSGVEFLEVFDRTPFSDVPVIIISAYRPKPGELDDRFVFLGKPLDLEVLLATVRKRLRER